MCIAIFNKAKYTLTKETFNNCWDKNRDGGGMMYAVDGKLHIFKSLFKGVFKKEYARVREKYPDIDIVLHFRWSTHGGETMRNVHPHRVSKDIAFVHNGVLDRVVEDKEKDVKVWDKKEKKWTVEKQFTSNLSDSVHFSKMLKDLPTDFLDNEAILTLIESYIEDDNKLIFMDSTGKHVIVNEDKGVWDCECWFSNEGYKTPPKKKKKVKYKYKCRGYYDMEKRKWISAEEEEKELAEKAKGTQKEIGFDKTSKETKDCEDGECGSKKNRNLLAETPLLELDSPRYGETSAQDSTIFCEYCDFWLNTKYEEEMKCCQNCFDFFNAEAGGEA